MLILFAISFLARSVMYWERVAPRILKHSTRIMVCLGKGKIQAFELQLPVFSPPCCSFVVIFGRMTLASEAISQYHRIPSKVIF